MAIKIKTKVKKKPEKRLVMSNNGLSIRPYSPNVRYDRDVLREELRIWTELESSINICQFCAEKGYLPSLLLSLVKQDEGFAWQYGITKCRLAERRERLVNERKLDQGSYHRYQRGYDEFLKKEEDEKLVRETEIKKALVQNQAINLATLVTMIQQGKHQQIE